MARTTTMFGNGECLPIPSAGFTPKELEEFFSLAKKHRYVPGFTLVRRLLSISQKKRRMQFAQRIMREGWGHH